jgi:hypothetical protein
VECAEDMAEDSCGGKYNQFIRVGRIVIDCLSELSDGNMDSIDSES